MKEIGKLTGIFTEMVENAKNHTRRWKNITLGRKAFTIMRELPDVLPDAYDTPAAKAELLGNMLDQMDETSTPRFCIQVREYMLSLDPEDSDNIMNLEQLRDYIDLSIPMEEYCRKYHRRLKFDPVERTPQMEEICESVERECAEATADHRRGMGFCFMYWSIKRDILSKYGIEWNSPATMNPRVMFD